MKAILGRKIGMSQLFTPDGQAHGATLIKAAPCTVSQIRIESRDGYTAVQVMLNEPQGKIIKREFRLRDAAPFKINDTVTLDTFQVGDRVKVTSISKAQGFQGVVKRHGFAGHSSTHGTKHAKRQPGSIGQVWPQRVPKGRRMAGRMGGETVAVMNLKVLAIDSARNLIALEGAVPGWRGTLVKIEASDKLNIKD